MKEKNVEIKEKVLQLTEEKRYSELQQYIEQLAIQDLALLFEEIDDEEKIRVFRLLPKDDAADVFSYMEPDLQEQLINSFTDTELKQIVDELYMDDTVDLIEEMPSNVVKRILKSVTQKDRDMINELLNYPEDSAGTIMTTEFIDLKVNMTVEEAFAKIRKIGIDNETVYTCYVLNIRRKIIGLITVKELLLAQPTTLIKDIMETNVITVNTLDDKEEVAKKFDKYDFIALPVVDKEERLVGIITVDDALDVLQEEATEDFEIMAAMTPSEDSYFKTPVWKLAKNRVVWLLLLMISAMLTGAILEHYEAAFAALPLLVSFVPMVMGTGGNCGSQSSTMIIRGMATDEIRLNDYFKAAWKEFRVAILVGVVLAVVNGIRIMIQYHDLKIALVVGLTLIFTVVLAKLLGCSLPMLAKKLKMDPAIMAAPFISTILDSCSVLIFFKIAVTVMGI